MKKLYCSLKKIHVFLKVTMEFCAQCKRESYTGNDEGGPAPD